MSILRPRLVLVALVAAAALIVSACGQDAEVAAVGASSLSEEDLRTLLAEGGSEPASAPTAVAAEAVGEWLFWELLIAEVADRGFTIIDEDLAAGRDALALGGAPGGVPEPGSRYEEMLIRYRAVPHLVARWLEDGEGVVPPAPAVMCSSHILLTTEEEAEAAIARFEAGEDFADLAIELSIGPSGPTGGDLGCVDPAGFVPEFVVGARAVDPPGISAPTESEFGWHVIFVDSFDETEFVDVAARDQAVITAAQDLVVELQEAAIARDLDLAERYGTWDATTAQVVPPDADASGVDADAP